MPDAGCFRKSASGWAVCFAGFALLYLLTLQTGWGWQDSGGFQLAALGTAAGSREEHAVWGNLALAHPAYLWVLRTARALFGPSPSVANGVSAVSMAAAVANVWLCAFLFAGRGRVWVANLTAAALGFSHMCWWMATIAEVYALDAALMSGEALLLGVICRGGSRRARASAWVALAGLSGLHWSVHDFALLAGPVYATLLVVRLVRRDVPWPALVAAVFAFVLGSAPILDLIAARAALTGPVEAVVNAFVGNVYGATAVGFTAIARGLVVMNLGLFALNFLNPAWWPGAAAVVRRAAKGPRTDAFERCLLGLAAIHFAFFIRYFVADQATFAIPTLVTFALLAAAGLGSLGRSPRPVPAGLLVLALAALAPVGYYGACRALSALGVGERGEAAAPLRDDVRYWALPWKHDEDSADRFVRAVIAETETDAVISADFVTYLPLQAYLTANPGLRANRKVCGPQFSRGDNGRPVDYRDLVDRYWERPWYVVRPFPGYTEERLLDWEYEKTGVLYRRTVKERGERSSP